MLLLGFTVPKRMPKPDQHAPCGLGATWGGGMLSPLPIRFPPFVLSFTFLFFSYSNTFLSPPALPFLAYSSLVCCVFAVFCVFMSYVCILALLYLV